MQGSSDNSRRTKEETFIFIQLHVDWFTANIYGVPPISKLSKGG